jgi:hypothetical protein
MIMQTSVACSDMPTSILAAYVFISGQVYSFFTLILQKNEVELLVVTPNEFVDSFISDCVFQYFRNKSSLLRTQE